MSKMTKVLKKNFCQDWDEAGMTIKQSENYT